MVTERADPVGAQPYLTGRLLAGDVEGVVLIADRLGCDVEEEGGLVDTGSPARRGRAGTSRPLRAAFGRLPAGTVPARGLRGPGPT
ncbi:hypothetical protein GCM10027073_60640 [Streptomyces chlorus]